MTAAKPAGPISTAARCKSRQSYKRLRARASRLHNPSESINSPKPTMMRNDQNTTATGESRLRGRRELARVLRPGGTMAVTVPRCGPEFINWALSDEYHNVPGGHVRIYRQSQLVGRLQGTGLKAVGSHHAHGLHAPYWWLRCLVGPTNDSHPAVSTYHRLLVWDIEKAPKVTRYADRVLNPLVGKSLVVYLEKPWSADEIRHEEVA